MKFGSLFAGIGGIDKALRDAGAESSFSVEIDNQCNSVRRRHWPTEEQHTDVTTFSIRSTEQRPDIMCAGWPCQGNSVAGLRGGMADERSGLWGQVKRNLGEFAPRWFLGENVPGILSVNGGKDWLTVLRDLAELGYGFAYRILDAQWFGVAQRRRRVFIVGCLGDWRSAAEILFEPESLPWNPTPSREAGTRTAACLTRGTESRGRGGYAGRRREDDYKVVNCLDRHMGSGGPDDNAAQAGHLVSALDTKPYADHESKESRLVVTHSLRAEGADASEDGTGRGTPIIPIDMRQASRGGTMTNNRKEGSSGGAPGTGIGEDGDPSPTLADSHTPAVAYQCHGSNVGPMGTIRSGNGNETGGVPFLADTLTANWQRSNGAKAGNNTGMLNPIINRFGVRRLTPRECERLQGFPDDWTRYGHDGKEISDSARYRMVGNSVAVPCVAWIARRIVERCN